MKKIRSNTQIQETRNMKQAEENPGSKNLENSKNQRKVKKTVPAVERRNKRDISKPRP